MDVLDKINDSVFSGMVYILARDENDKWHLQVVNQKHGVISSKIYANSTEDLFQMAVILDGSVCVFEEAS